MAVITDPDQLTQGVEITINTTTLELELAIAGNLSEDGVTGQVVYSFLKEEWINQVNNVHLFTFPMLAITSEQFEVGNNGSVFSNWTWDSDATRKLIRTAGWREYNDAGAVLREYASIITLGNINATSKTVGNKAYYFFDSDTTQTSFTYAGPVNETVQVFGDVTNGNFDKRSDVLTVRIREQGNVFSSATTTEIGVSNLTYKVERFPLGETTDLNINTTDVGIDADSDGVADVAPFDGMSITYFATPQTSAAGGTVTVRIDGNSADKLQIYEFVQWSLRQNVDIDAGAATAIGLLAEELLEFEGNTLKTKRQSDGSGVDIINFEANDTNDLVFIDDAGVTQTFPFVSAGTINFNSNLQNDATAKYWVFFTNDDAGADTGQDFGSEDAIIVNDNSGTPLTGLINGASSVTFDYDYDGNTQRGAGSESTDAPFTVVAIGTSGAQYTQATSTVTRATGQTITLVAALERNYNNS